MEVVPKPLYEGVELFKVGALYEHLPAVAPLEPGDKRRGRAEEAYISLIPKEKKFGTILSTTRSQEQSMEFASGTLMATENRNSPFITVMGRESTWLIAMAR